MARKSFITIIFFMGLLLAIPGTGACNGVLKSFDFYADLFENGRKVWVQLQYYKKFGDHYKIIAYSPVRVTIQNGRYDVLIPDRYYVKDNYLEIVFDAGYVTPKIDLFPMSNYTPRPIYILLGALFIAIVSRIRFNRWTQKNVGQYAFQPRSFTTWPRFIRSALLYVMVVEAYYLIIIYSPETLIFIDKYMGGGHIDYDLLNEMGQYSVLWSIFLLTGVLPNFPWVSKWETAMRDMLQGYAFIPSEAKAVISQLNINYTAFKPDDKVIARILPRVGTDTFSPDDFHIVSERISHKWCKLSYLRYRLVDWMTFPTINKFFSLSNKNYDLFLTEYDRVKSEIDEYFGYVRLHADSVEEIEDTYNGNGLLNATRTKLNDDLDSCLNKAYNFICIGILGTEKMPGGRKKAFNFFGLAPFIPERNKIDWDTNIKTIGVLASAVFLPTLLYYIMSRYGFIAVENDYFPKDAREALYWSLVGITMHSLTIVSVVLLDRWRTRIQTSLYDEEKNIEAAPSPNLVNDLIAASFGLLVGFAIMGSYVFFELYAQSGNTPHEIVKKLSDMALWSLLPAVTGFYIQYYLNSVRSQNIRVAQLSLQQGLIMAVIAAVVTFTVIDQDGVKILYFMVYAAFTSFCVGAGIGYVFPRNYLSKYNKSSFTEDRRNHLRAFVMEPATAYVDGSRYACNIVDISNEGAKVDRALRFPSGSHVQINTAHLGKLNSIIVRKVKKGTIIKFPYLDASTQGQIAAYLEKYAR